MATLGVVDYVIFAAMLLGTLAIGILHAFIGGRQQTTSEYFLGDRKMHVLPVSISLSASFFSAILILGHPAEAYTNGGIFWLAAAAFAIGSILTCIIFIPVFHPLKLISVNDYLFQRFQSRLIGILGTISAILIMVLFAGIVNFAPATTIQGLTGFPTWATIIIGTAISIIYTSLGGIKAVVWTDVFQATLMLIGLLAVSITAISEVGGISEVWEVCDKWGRLNLLDLRSDPTIRLTFWSMTIGFGITEMGRYGVQQMAVQRYSSLPTLTKARLAVLLLIPIVGVMAFLGSLSGVSIFAYYAKRGCDPLRAGKINNPNQLVPFFVASALQYPGVLGILLASICAASLSTSSSALNACSANVWNDILCRIWPNMSEKRNVVVTKLLVVFFGIVSMGLAFAFVNIGGTLIQMVITFTSICGGPTTAMFLMGMFFPMANWIGVFVGTLVGFTFGLWMGFGSYSINIQRSYLPSTIENCTSVMGTTTVSSMFTTTPVIEPTENPLYDFYSVSFLWISCFTLIMSIVVGLIVSLVSGGMKGPKIPARYLHPWIRRCYHGNTNDESDMPVKSAKDENGYEKNVENGSAYIIDTNDRTTNIVQEQQ